VQGSLKDPQKKKDQASITRKQKKKKKKKRRRKDESLVFNTTIEAEGKAATKS